MRLQMVASQLVPRGILEPRVLEAFRKIPRESFVPENERAFAYDDIPLPIGEGQTISQPYMVAVMTELLQLKGKEKVLEIGTGSGYQSAVLAELSDKVYTIERVGELSKKAESIIKKLGYHNVTFLVGDGTKGHPEASPYDAVMVTAACPSIPRPLFEQLKEGGRLVLPVGERYHQLLTRVIKRAGKMEIEESIPCVFVPLIGKYGWEK